MSVGEELSRLESLARTFGPGASQSKIELIDRLEPRAFATSSALLRFHEALLVIRVQPDDHAVLDRVVSALERFERRADVRRHRRDLVDSGIAGAPIRHPFHWVTARWLARHWPERLTLDWSALDDHAPLELLMHRLLGWAEAVEPGASRRAFRRYLERFATRGEALGAFLVRRFERLRASESLREHLFESLSLPLELEPGRGGPNRTTAAFRDAPITWQTKAPTRRRPNFRRAASKAALSVRWLRGAEAEAAIDMARVTMITRSRDLDAIKHGNPGDVRWVDAGRGLAFVCIGVLPEQRPLLETLYVFLVVQNGVPIGYYQAALLFGCAELNFNVFPTWRGGETAMIYARGAAMVRDLFRVDAFAVPPYQIGHENEEALASGAYWFYAKLGFRPDDPAIRRLFAVELSAIRKDRRHRSSRAVLRELAKGYLYFHFGRARDDVHGKVAHGAIGEAVSRALNERFGSDRERGLRVASREAASLLGAVPSGWTRDEREAWNRWAPLVTILPGVAEWPRADRRALAELIRAKGATVEEDFAARFAAHRRLRAAIVKLAR